MSIGLDLSFRPGENIQAISDKDTVSMITFDLWDLFENRLRFSIDVWCCCHGTSLRLFLHIHPQLSPAIVGGLHNIARTIESQSYTEGLNIHTHIVSNSNFSETSAFMPVLKVVLTQANKLKVWSDNIDCSKNVSPVQTDGGEPVVRAELNGFRNNSQEVKWRFQRCMKKKLSLFFVPLT